MALTTTNAPTSNPSVSGGTQTTVAFILITSLFFFWGFLHNLDPILIKHLRKTFQLNALQASLVDSAVFFAYFIMALPAGMIMKKLGYKSGILIGLGLFAAGAFLFLPAADFHSYAFFLGALFIIASGLTFLETAANPYVTVLGAPETATQRINFAQSFNGLAAFLAPLVGRNFILSGKEYTTDELDAMTEEVRTAYFQMEAASVKTPFLVLGSIILLVALLFFFTRLPDIKGEDSEHNAGLKSAWRHIQLRWGVVAQFFYVGAQVCILSFFMLYAAEVVKLNERDAAEFAAVCGLAFMVGRFAGTALMKYIAPVRLLLAYALICAALTVITIVMNGMITIYAMIGITFFMSIMFPTIFSLGIEGIGNDTKMGSSLIIMSIVGGAILPPALAGIADSTGRFQLGYVVPLICFGVIALFAATMNKRRKNLTL
mgnify:CR=1 FL=1